MALEFENFRKHWIWAVIATCIPIGLGIASYYLQYKSSRHELGGFLNATFHNRSIRNKDSRTIIICVDDTTNFYQNIYITPTFDNTDEYSLRDFSLNFETTAEGVKLIPSSFVKEYETGENSSIFKYEQDVLQAHMDTKNPFMGFKLKKDLARCEVISKVSFDGAASLFIYRTDIWFVYTPNKNYLSYEYWKLNCKQKVFNLIEESCFDIYYIAKNEAPEYQFDVLLSSDNNKNLSNNNTTPKGNITIETNHGTSRDNNIEPIKKSEENNKSDFFYKEGYITINNFTDEQESESSELEVSDYILIPGDTLRYLVTFKQSARKSGNYIIKYKKKDGFYVISQFRVVYLNKGDDKCFLYINDNKKITNVEIYHPVNPSNYLKVTNTKDGKLFINSDHLQILYGILYENGSYYIREQKNIIADFDKPVIIEIFDRPHYWYEKIFEDKEGKESYKIAIYLFGFLLFWCLLFLNSSYVEKILHFEDFGFYVLILGAIVALVAVICLFAMFIQIIGMSLFNYIYLSI